MKHYFRSAIVVALFTATVSAYGVYTWLKEARADVPGVSCFTGKFPALVPVK